VREAGGRSRRHSLVHGDVEDDERCIEPFVPAKAGTQSGMHSLSLWPWMPACAGTNGVSVNLLEP